MMAKTYWLIMPDIKFGTTDLTIEHVLVTDIYPKHVDPIGKVYINKAIGTVFMPMSLLYATEHDALVALRDRSNRIAKRAEEELNPK